MWGFYLRYCGDVSWNTVEALDGSRSCPVLTSGVTGIKSSGYVAYSKSHILYFEKKKISQPYRYTLPLTYKHTH
jgi:hypothetical protein